MSASLRHRFGPAHSWYLRSQAHSGRRLRLTSVHGAMKRCSCCTEQSALAFTLAYLSLAAAPMLTDSLTCSTKRPVSVRWCQSCAGHPAFRCCRCMIIHQHDLPLSCIRYRSDEWLSAKSPADLDAAWQDAVSVRVQI